MSEFSNPEPNDTHFGYKTVPKEDKEKLLASIPKTLVGDPSKGGIKSTDWAGPTELESVIGR